MLFVNYRVYSVFIKVKIYFDKEDELKKYKETNHFLIGTN